MEYKKGQRFKILEDDELYVINNQKAPRYLYARVPDGPAQGIAHEDVMTPYYKPGDQVRVIATEEELKELYLYDYCATGSIIPVDDYIPGIMGSDIISDSYSVPLEFIEWYSGVEDKPDDAEQFFDSLQEHEMHGFSTPEEYIKWLKDDTILVAEVHQDKDRNRAALAEVLKIKETPQQLWKCPYYDNHTHRPCNETGSIHDIRQHCVVAHGESLPPPESKSYWKTWRVS